MQLPFLCEKSGAIALVLLGLTAGRQNGWPADKILLIWKFLKLYTGWNIQVFAMLTKVQCYYRCTNAFRLIFCIKPTLRWILDTPKFWMPFFPGQSLLLSNTILNDTEKFNNFNHI